MMTEATVGRTDDVAGDDGAGARGGPHDPPTRDDGAGFAPVRHRPEYPPAPPPRATPLPAGVRGGVPPRDGCGAVDRAGPAPATAAPARPSSKRPLPEIGAVVGPPTPVKSRKTAEESQAQAASPAQAQLNPYSTSRGLRHFSMKVCEKVEEKGTTTYNEVADELVRELQLAEEALDRAAEARGEVPAARRRKGGGNRNGKPRPPGSARDQKSHDHKNIRRRVYDALNVLMAMDIITKDKKEITWRGLPGSGGGDGDGAAAPGSGRADRPAHCGRSRRQRVQRLREDRARRDAAVRAKRECLRELLTQNVCFRNLLRRNHAREMERRRESADVVARSAADAGAAPPPAAPAPRIPLPFLVVSTDSRAVIQCDMDAARTSVSFDFSLPFEVNDDNEILKQLGMSHASKESLQRLLPPDLFQYSNNNGLLESIAEPR